MYSPTPGSNPCTCSRNTTSTRCISTAIGSSNFCKFGVSEPAGDPPPLTIPPPMPCSLRGVQRGVNLEAQIALDLVLVPRMIGAMSARGYNSFALVVVVAIIAACTRDPEHAAVRRIEALIRENHLQEAMHAANACVRRSEERRVGKE